MKKIISAAQMRDADRHTVDSLQISSLELMENASIAFVAEFCLLYEDLSQAITLFCGSGNNGGDGLAIARLLHLRGYQNLKVCLFPVSKEPGLEYSANLQRLGTTSVSIHDIDERFTSPFEGIVIDAILGSGLNRPVTGQVKALIQQINNCGLPVISVDVPSGLPADGRIDLMAVTIRAELAITFQRPKLSFFFPESVSALKQFKVVDIGLNENYIQQLDSPWLMTEREDIVGRLARRKLFSHKGTYGHALVVAGNTVTMGAAILSVEACLAAGVGLISAAIPRSGLTSLNSRVPEAMFVERDAEMEFGKYSAIAIGPGLGTDEQCRVLLDKVCQAGKPLVADADVFSILSQHPGMINQLPTGSILTPHMKEFDRVFGAHENWFDRVETAREKALKHECIIVLKNQYSFLAMPNGQVLINTTGNPGMATGGTGDVLTGIIVSFLAQGYDPADAAIIACFLHGEAADELRGEGMAVIRPTELIRRLPFVIGRFST